MKNLKISTRLSAAFGLLVLLLVGLAIAAVAQLKAMRTATVDITENWLPSVQAVSRIDAQAAELRLIVLSHVMNTDDAAIKKIDQQLLDERAKMAKLREAYERLISSPEEKRLYEEFAGHWKNYIAVNDKALELSRRNDNDAARVIVEGESRKLYDAAGVALEKLVALNDKGASESKADSEHTFKAALTVLLIVSAVALAVAILAALWLIRSITAPLSRAVAVADQVSAGDLTAQIQVDSQDETGQLLSALQKMQQSLVRTVSVVR